MDKEKENEISEIELIKDMNEGFKKAQKLFKEQIHPMFDNVNLGTSIIMIQFFKAVLNDKLDDIYRHSGDYVPEEKQEAFKDFMESTIKTIDEVIEEMKKQEDE